MLASPPRRTLISTTTQATALVRRQATDLLQALRLQVEADPGCGQMNRLRQAEGHLTAGRLLDAVDEARAIERALQARAEAVVVEAGLSDAIAREKERNPDAAPERTEAGPIIIPARDGLLWLSRKKVLTWTEQAAAEKYRAQYAAAAGGGFKSCIDDRVRGGGRSSSSPASTQLDAIWALDDARKALLGDEPLIWLLDEVAGKGTTLRDLAKGDKHATAELQTQFRVACRLLAKHYGIGR